MRSLLDQVSMAETCALRGAALSYHHACLTTNEAYLLMFNAVKLMEIGPHGTARGAKGSHAFE
jgi:hypothetical protein